MGHEPTGTIAKVGSEVTKFKVGDRVFAHHHVGCISCISAAIMPSVRTSASTGWTRWYGGVFQSAGRHTRFDTLLLPDNVSFEVGTLIEPISCTLRGIKITPFL